MTEHALRLLVGSDAVRAVVRPNGRCEAWEFLEAQPINVLARFNYFFERLRSGHRLKIPEHMRHLHTEKSDGVQVHELKVGHPRAVRLYLIPHGSGWLLTHGGAKVKKNALPAEIAKAVQIYRDWRTN